MMQPPSSRCLWLLSGLVLVAGCAQPGVARLGPSAAAPPPAKTETGVVFIVNGAGGSTMLSDNLIPLVREAGLPLGTEVITWTLGQGVFADHSSVTRHAQAARSLVDRIAAYRASHPHNSVTLVGHSSGSHIVLLAAASLPENSLDRIILLAPSVAASYDLAPALRATRCGIDSFSSAGDGVLGAVDAFMNTADGQAGPAAGRTGFAPPVNGSPAAPLYGRLRQHRYRASYQLHGNFGGHYGWARSAFLREVIVPILRC